MTVRLLSTAPHRKKVQRATAALGLLCVLTAGNCWAQTESASAAQPAKSAKPAAEAKQGKTAKPAASTKTASSKTASSKKTQPAHAKSSGKSTDKSEKAEAKPADAKNTDKPVAKTELKSESKTDSKADSKLASTFKPEITKLADAGPPPGTMMGAYGQSLMRNAGHTSAPLMAQGGSVAAPTATPVMPLATTPTPAPVAAAPVVATTAAAPALPPTAMMGAAGTAAVTSDSVAKFMQQRGIVAQAQVETDAHPSLLNSVRDRASDLVLSAMNFLGVPYRLGGNSVNNGFDCSGFTRHIFEMSVGLVLPRRADEQAKLSSLIPIKKDDLKPGDLVFFNTMRATFSHVGIYVGEGKFIHSPRAGGAVRVEDMREAYWAKRFTGARRADLNQATPGT